MNLSTIQAWVKEATSTANADQSRVLDCIREAQRDFRRDTQLRGIVPYSKALVAGTATYDLDGLTTPGALRILSAAIVGPDTGSRPIPIEIVEFNEQVDLATSLTGNATPWRIVTLGLDQILLQPTPGSGCTLSGFCVDRPVELTNGSDEPDEPEEYHRAIVYRAIQLVLEWDRQPLEDVMAHEQMYLKEVGRALSAKKRVAGFGPKHLRPHSSQVAGRRPHTFRGAVGLD